MHYLYRLGLLTSLFLSLGNIVHVHAQFYLTGNDPASLRWKQIRTEQVQVMFPEGFEARAQELTNTLHYLANRPSRSLSAENRPISVVLHNLEAQSNGFVTWAPRRMELYTLPAPGQHAQDRLQSLAIHEMRHVVQMDRMNQAIPKPLKWMLGQQAPGIISGLLPRWYLEGDAVAAETALSSSGRGRDPLFDLRLRALTIQSPDLFHYEKATMGSFRDWTPDPYVLGYHMVAHIRQKYGPEILALNVEHTSRRFYQLFPFHLGLKKITGKNSRELYRETLDSLREVWASAPRDTALAARQHLISRRSATYTDYLSPRFVARNSILCWKEGPGDLRKFVLMDTLGQEQVLHTTGPTYSDHFDVRADRWVWTELINDARWAHESYSVVRIGDLKTGRVRTLTRKTRHYDPSFSQDGQKLAVISATPTLEYALEILDAETGRVLRHIPTPQNLFAQCPVWDSTDSSIYLIITGDHGKRIENYHLGTDTWRVLIPDTYMNLSGMHLAEGWLFFNGSHQDQPALYALHVRDQRLYVTLGGASGVSDADLREGKLIYNIYTSDGASLAINDLSPQNWTPASITRHIEYGSSRMLSEQEQWNVQQDSIPPRKDCITRYSKWGHALNIHSWAPVFVDYQDLNDAGFPGVSLTSQDLLETTLISAGWKYEQQEHHLFAGITLKGGYPVWKFSVEYGGDPPLFTAFTQTPSSLPDHRRLEMKLLGYIPWTYSRGQYRFGWTPLASLAFKDGYTYHIDDQNFHRGHLEVSYGFQAIMMRKQAPRDLFPRAGWTLNARWTHNPFDDEDFGSIGFVSGQVFLPGLGKHHSFRLTLGGQYQHARKAFYRSELDFPRGYPEHLSTRLITWSLDYALPLVCPDWSLGFGGYIKRIWIGGFLDGARNAWDPPKSVFGWNQTFREHLRSYGADLMADVHILRIIFPVQTGIRMSYIPREHTLSTQWLFRISLTQ
jgi:hypothetical protein